MRRRLLISVLLVQIVGTIGLAVDPDARAEAAPHRAPHGRGLARDEPACPCSDAALCRPITRTGGENVYVFHTAGALNWRQYDWSVITTVCVFGVLDPQLLCHAHANNARVTLGHGGPHPSQWGNSTAVSAWVTDGVQRVQAAFADGLNIDIEYSVTTAANRSLLTALTARMARAVRAAVPTGHVTFDVPSNGLAQAHPAHPGASGAEPCGQMYERDYDFKALAGELDFLVSMDYDSQGWHGTPYAQSALPEVEAGVACYASLGVPASKLVLGFPWYAYRYTCAHGDQPGGTCSITAHDQVSYTTVQAEMAHALGPVVWDNVTQTPHFWYRDSPQGNLYRMDYDDVRSLGLKYGFARRAGVRGVGMWTADEINYNDTATVAAFWKALHLFKP